MAVVTTNFAVVKLPVKDLESSARWYQDVMGIPFTFDFKPGDNEAWLNVGGVGLGLIRCPNVPKLDFSGMVAFLLAFRSACPSHWWMTCRGSSHTVPPAPSSTGFLLPNCSQA
jgi:catechol-2,3-dioxygenase